MPFIGTEAVAAGIVTRRTLRSRHDAVYRNVYLPKGARADAGDAGGGGVVVVESPSDGRRAVGGGAARHEVDRRRPARGVVPPHRQRRRRHRDPPRRTRATTRSASIDGMPATTPARTAFDLGRRGWPYARRHTARRAWRNATRLRAVDVVPLRRVDHRGARGIVQLREALDLMDGGAESPQETRTRLLLVARGTAATADSDRGLRRLRRTRSRRIDMG